MGLICFAQIYRAPKRSDCYQHQILKITSQSLKLKEKMLMMQCIAVQRHQYNLILHVVGDLAII